MISIRCIYDLEAPHRGHRFQSVELHVAGEPDEAGIVVEYEAIDRVVVPVLRLAAHDLITLHERCSTPEAAQLAADPTAERLVTWLGARLAGIVASSVNGRRLRLVRVTAREDARSAVEWTPPTPRPTNGRAP